MNTTWKPQGLIDVVAFPTRMPDPEAHLYAKNRRWVLVVDSRALDDGADWSDDTVAFVCVEAIRERPTCTAWERRARRVFFVRREDVAKSGLVGGVIEGSARYKLRDIAASPELSADGRAI